MSNWPFLPWFIPNECGIGHIELTIFREEEDASSLGGSVVSEHAVLDGKRDLALSVDDSSRLSGVVDEAAV